MFRPNRIGTPHIAQLSLTTSTQDWTPNVINRFAPNTIVNVINTVAIQDFGSTLLEWDGAAAEAIAANGRFLLGHQIVITQPVEGDTVGLELMATLNGSFPASASFEPFFIQLTSNPALLGQATTGGQFFPLGPTQIHDVGDDTVCLTGHHYKTQVIFNNPTPAGVYAHGFAIADNSGAGYNLEYFRMNAAVRQLNDQQNVNYRDTRR